MYELNDRRRGRSTSRITLPFGSSLSRAFRIPRAAPGSLGTIVRAYKASVTYRINTLRGKTEPPIWQRNYYDHIVRNEKEYEDICKYIESNPINWTDDPLNPFPDHVQHQEYNLDNLTITR
jgi:hypothetical protein